MARMSYTGKDINLIRAELIRQIPALTTKWTDLNASDVGMTLLELIASMGDFMAYYIDEQFLECLLPTVSERKNMASILSLIGYKMRPVVSSTSTVEFSLTDPYFADIVIPKKTVLSSLAVDGRRYFFTTCRAVTIPAGETSVTVNVTEGLKKVLALTTHDILDYKIVLTDTDIDIYSMEVSIDGIAWTQVEDIFLLREFGRYFNTDINRNGICTLVFPPNWTAYVDDDQTSEIAITYNVTLGDRVYFGTDFITKIESTIKDSEDNDVTSLLALTNTEYVSGGEPQETLQEARDIAPRVLRSMWTAVTLEDYEALALNYPGVAKAKAVDWSVNDSGINTPWLVRVLAVDSRGRALRGQLASNLLAYLRERKVTCVDIDLMTPMFIDVDITADVFTRYGANLEEVRTAVESALTTFFAVDTVDFGTDIYHSNITTAIEGAHREISHVDLRTPSNDVIVLSRQFPRKGTVEINVS